MHAWVLWHRNKASPAFPGLTVSFHAGAPDLPRTPSTQQSWPPRASAGWEEPSTRRVRASQDETNPPNPSVHLPIHPPMAPHSFGGWQGFYHRGGAHGRAAGSPGANLEAHLHPKFEVHLKESHLPPPRAVAPSSHQGPRSTRSWALKLTGLVRVWTPFLRGLFHPKAGAIPHLSSASSITHSE